MIALVLMPALLGILTLFLRGTGRRLMRRRVMIGGALFHNLGTASLYFTPWLPLGEYLRVDSLGLFFLSITSGIFTIVSFYSLGYFPLKRMNEKTESGGHVYASCMLFFIAAMSLSALTQHVGVLWIAIEATTLASAPLVYYQQNRRSLEAAWKYLLICSVGIAIALLGVFFVAAACHGTPANLSLPSLMEFAPRMDQKLLRLGFILVMIGFGTKTGLAPLHSWLPDAHSEAPSPVSALLSATLLNCALLGILRFYGVCDAAHAGAFANRLMIIFGLTSLFVAAVFMSYQKDLKRLLAYSSIEHMGIIVLGVGVGAKFAAMLHVLGHSVAKALLFMAAGNVMILYRTKRVAEIGGLMRTSPVTGTLLIVGGFSILGMPPFLPFISEFLILRGGLLDGHYAAMALYLLFLGAIFFSMSRALLKMAQGARRELIPDTLSMGVVYPPVVLAVVIVCLGLYIPATLARVISSASGALGF